MVSTLPLISKFSSPCTNPLVIVPGAPITIGITVTFIFHSFFSSLARCWYLSLFSFSFSFTQWSAGLAMYTIWQVLFCFVDYLLVLLLLLLFSPLQVFSHYHHCYYFTPCKLFTSSILSLFHSLFFKFFILFYLFIFFFCSVTKSIIQACNWLYCFSSRQNLIGN